MKSSLQTCEEPSLGNMEQHNPIEQDMTSIIGNLPMELLGNNPQEKTMTIFKDYLNQLFHGVKANGKEKSTCAKVVKSTKTTKEPHYSKWNKKGYNQKCSG
jgi:c-di-AMP phosphodiesterase-like protein